MGSQKWKPLVKAECCVMSPLVCCRTPSGTHKAVRDKCTEYTKEENTMTESTVNNQKKKQQKEMDRALEEIFCRPQINLSVIFVIISSAAFILFSLKIMTHIILIIYTFRKRPVVVVILLLSH